MSTRSAIGQVINKEEGIIRAVYCHFDGYPSGVGQTLLETLRRWGPNSEGRLLETLLNEKVGWSSLADRDLDLPPMWDETDFSNYATDPVRRHIITTNANNVQRFKLLYTQDPQGHASFEEYMAFYVGEHAPRSYTERGETVFNTEQGDDHHRSMASVEASDCEFLYLFDLEQQHLQIYAVGFRRPSTLLATIAFDWIHDSEEDIKQRMRLVEDEDAESE